MKHIVLVCLFVLAALPVRADFGLSNMVRKEIHHSPGMQESIPEPPAQKNDIPQMQPQAVEQAEPPAREGTLARAHHYPFTIHLASWQDRNDALRQYERLRSRMDPVFITKIDLGPSGIWYRLDFGAFTTIKDAVMKLQEMKTKGLVDKGSFVGGSVPYAIELGTFKAPEEAKARLKYLADKGIVTYVVKEQEGVYRLLSGAYPDQQSASAAMKDLSAMNMNPAVKKR
jgi:cell division septation protein DedD